jgi:hypothetical protein
MNLLSLVSLRLDNICQIRQKWYYSSGSKKFLQTKPGLNTCFINLNTILAIRVAKIHSRIQVIVSKQFVTER